MLKIHLQEIKGRLLHYYFEVYSDMNSFEEDGKAKINYEEFYVESEHCIKEIFRIQSVSDLDVFCEEWGLNDLQNDLAFNNLAKYYLELKSLSSI